MMRNRFRKRRSGCRGSRILGFWLACCLVFAAAPSGAGAEGTEMPAPENMNAGTEAEVLIPVEITSLPEDSPAEEPGDPDVMSEEVYPQEAEEDPEGTGQAEESQDFQEVSGPDPAETAPVEAGEEQEADPENTAEDEEQEEDEEENEEEDEEDDGEKDREEEFMRLYGSTEPVPEAFGMDFSSCRLLVGIQPDALSDSDWLLSSYRDVCLLQYPDERQAMLAWGYYRQRAAFAEPDITVRTAEEGTISAEAPSGGMTETDNPLYSLQEEIGSLPPSGGRSMVALVDTGITDGPYVSERISLVGGSPDDDNGHGDRMAGFILEKNPDACILSVKALEADGSGTLSSVYAAVEYAAAAGANVINLSFSAPYTIGNAVLEDAVSRAAGLGIIVTGAAGNDGADARGTVPGGILSAWIAGACDEAGGRRPWSNYGDTVDCFVTAETTSEAAAKLAGLFSRYGEEIPAGSGVFAGGKPFGTENADGEAEDPEVLPEEEASPVTAADMPGSLNVVKIRENALNLSVHYVKETLELLYCVEKVISSDSGTYRAGNARYTLSPELRSAISYVLAHGMQKVGETCADPKYRSGSDRVMTMAGRTFYSRDYHLTQCAIWDLIRTYTGNNSYGGVIRSVMPVSTEDQRNAVAKCEQLVADAAAWAKANPGGTFISGSPELILPESALAENMLVLTWNEEKGLYESEPFSVSNLQTLNVQQDGGWVKAAALPEASDIRTSDGRTVLKAVRTGEVSYDGRKGTAVYRLQMTAEDAASEAEDAVYDVRVWEETVHVWGVHLYKQGSGQTTSLVREESSRPVSLALRARVDRKPSEGSDETRLVLMTGGPGTGPFAGGACILLTGAMLLARKRKRFYA